MGVENTPRTVRMSVPGSTLGEVASVGMMYAASPTLGAMKMPWSAFSPPRPAMRTILTRSYWAMRSDCCMSVTLDCTRVSLLLKSNRKRMPSMTIVVTPRATASSIRVNPPCPGRTVLGSRGEVIGGSSISFQDSQGDPFAGAQGTAATAALHPDLDLLEVHEGVRGPRGERVVELAVPVRVDQSAHPELLEGGGARPQRHVVSRVVAVDRGLAVDPLLVPLREVLGAHRRRRRDRQLRAVHRQRVQALELGLGVVGRLGVVGARAVVDDRLGEDRQDPQGDHHEDAGGDQHLDQRKARLPYRSLPVFHSHALPP